MYTNIADKDKDNSNKDNRIYISKEGSYNSRDEEWRYTLERQHSVRNPILINQDIDLLRRQFWEAASMTGIYVDFYNCCYDHSDFYQDPNLKWESAIYIPILFDDNPKIKTLKDYGWFSEDEDRPQLAYFPMYRDWQTKELLDLRENSLIRIPYFGQNTESEFRVMDKRLDSVYGTYWICKLAPERLNDFYLIDEHGEHYLKRNPNRSDDCEHEIKEGDIDKDNRRYENDKFVNEIVDDSDRDDYYDMIMNSATENTVDNYDQKENKDIIYKK